MKRGLSFLAFFSLLRSCLGNFGAPFLVDGGSLASLPCLANLSVALVFLNEVAYETFITVLPMWSLSGYDFGIFVFKFSLGWFTDTVNAILSSVYSFN